MKQKASIDRYIKTHLENLDVLEEEIGKGRGVLLCAFHMGKYRILPDWLATLGYKVKLVVGKDFKRNIHADFVALKRKLGYEPFDFIIAEEKTIAFEIKNSLNRGEIVMFFLDGNKGIGSNAAKADVVDFFDHRVYARSGALQIARLAKAPILVVDAQAKFLSQASFSFQSIKNAASPSVLLQDLYKRYENQIRMRPESWDQWIEFHMFWISEGAKIESVPVQMFESSLRDMEKTLGDLRARVRIDRQRIHHLLGGPTVLMVDLREVRFYRCSKFLAEFLPNMGSGRSMLVREILRTWELNCGRDLILNDLSKLHAKGLLQVL